MRILIDLTEKVCGNMSRRLDQCLSNKLRCVPADSIDNSVMRGLRPEDSGEAPKRTFGFVHLKQ